MWHIIVFIYPHTIFIYLFIYSSIHLFILDILDFFRYKMLTQNRCQEMLKKQNQTSRLVCTIIYLSKNYFRFLRNWSLNSS